MDLASIGACRWRNIQRLSRWKIRRFCKPSVNLGTFASILGIIIVIVQLAKTRSSVEEAKKQSLKTSKIVSEHLNKVNKAFVLADISEIILLPKDIQNNIQNGEYGRCYDKMQQLRDNLIEIQQNPEIISSALFSSDLDALISEINVRLRAVNLAVQKNKILMQRTVL